MMPPPMVRRRLLLGALPVAAAGILAACGSESISTSITANSQVPASVKHGAQLFSDRCAGCHNLDVVGAQGGALQIKDRERVDGPNFNVRKEDVNSVLYALRNGGFSGAIMPQNIVVGQDAKDVAEFLSRYAGKGTNQSTEPAQSEPGPQPGSQPPASQGSSGS
jgi:mono/diheme cytochrome c family protein